MATGPLMPLGTTQFWKGSAIDEKAPPTNIWQKNLEVSLLLVIAADEKLSWVPGPTDPVLVIERPGLAGSPRSQAPSKKGPARARTSLGVRAMSKADGIAVPLGESKFKMVWWRASTVKIDAAESRRSGSSRSVAPPR